MEVIDLTEIRKENPKLDFFLLIKIYEKVQRILDEEDIHDR